MATKKTASIDPLAGIPVATARAPKVAKTVAAPSGVINLAAAKKKRKLTGEDRKNAVEFARSMVGYDSSSPIWGKRLIVVLGDLNDLVTEASKLLAAGSIADADTALQGVATTVQELQKRVAFGQIMKAQS